MSEERHEKLTIEEIKQRLRTGYTFYPTHPDLQQAARELIRPFIEKMDGQEIICECRVAKLMRVNYLETNDEVNAFLAELKIKLEAAIASGQRIQIR